MIKLYWCRGKGRSDPLKRNFGDYLSKSMVEFLSKQDVIYSSIKKADLIAIGTVLGRLSKLRRFPFKKKITVWGTGSAESDVSFPSWHHYYAVRGKLTLAKIQQTDKSKIALGDPGLLVSMFPEAKIIEIKKYKIGVIAHYIDNEDPELKKLKENKAYKIISVYDDIQTIIRHIKQCEVILSSSLHGLIVADSLEVPNLWVKFSATKKAYFDYKVKDYYSIYGIDNPLCKEFPINLLNDELILIIKKQYHREQLDLLKNKLVNSFPYDKFCKASFLRPNI